MHFKLWLENTDIEYQYLILKDSWEERNIAFLGIFEDICQKETEYTVKNVIPVIRKVDPIEWYNLFYRNLDVPTTLEGWANLFLVARAELSEYCTRNKSSTYSHKVLGVIVKELSAKSIHVDEYRKDLLHVMWTLILCIDPYYASVAHPYIAGDMEKDFFSRSADRLIKLWNFIDYGE